MSKGGSLGVLPLGEKGRKDHSLPLLHAHSGIYHFSSLLVSYFLFFCEWQEETEILISRLLLRVIGILCSQLTFGLPLKMKGILDFLIAGTVGAIKLVSSLVRVCYRESLFQSNICIICFCWKFSCCPYYRGVCKAGVGCT